MRYGVLLRGQALPLSQLGYVTLYCIFRFLLLRLARSFPSLSSGVDSDGEARFSRPLLHREFSEFSEFSGTREVDGGERDV